MSLSLIYEKNIRRGCHTIYLFSICYLFWINRKINTRKSFAAWAAQSIRYLEKMKRFISWHRRNILRTSCSPWGYKNSNQSKLCFKIRKSRLIIENLMNEIDCTLAKKKKIPELEEIGAIRIKIWGCRAIWLWHLSHRRSPGLIRLM